MPKLLLKYLVAAGVAALGAMIPLFQDGYLPPEYVWAGPVLAALAVAMAARLKALGE